MIATAPLWTLLATSGASLGRCDPIVTADPAVAELATLRALEGRQLLGAFSRIGAHHPGPLPYYLLAPGYAALGATHPALCLSAVALNLGWLLVLMAVVARAWGTLRVWLCAPVVAALVAWAGPAVLWSVWNPDLGLVPLVLLVVGGGACARGDRALLPLVAFAASMASQCHVMYALPAAVTLGVCCAAVLATGGGDGEGTSRRTSGLATAGVLAVVWIPALVEQLSGEPGNLTLLARAALSPGAHTSTWPEAGGSLAYWLPAILGVGSGARAGTPWTGPGVVILGLALVAGTLGVLVRARHAFSCPWGPAAAWGAILGGSLIAVHGVSGEPQPYLVRWVAAVRAGGLMLAFATAPLRASLRRPVVVLAALVAVGLALQQSLTAAAADLCATIHARWASPDALRMVQVLRTHQRPADPMPTRVSWSRHRHWETAAGLFVAGARHGFELRAAGPGAWIFGASLAATGREPWVAVLTPARDPAEDSPGVGSRAERLRLQTLTVDQAWASGRIRVSDPASAAVFLDGWTGTAGRAESSFRWATGDRSRLVLPSDPKPVILVLEAAPLVVPGRAQSITVVTAATVTVALDRPGWQRISLPIAGGDGANPGVVALDPAYAASPRSIRGSDDDRPLAFRVRTLELVADPRRPARSRTGPADP